MAELVREIMIDATPDTIWPYLTEAGKHVEWEGTQAEIDPRPGGVYRVLVSGTYQSAGEFVEVVPQERLVFTFGWEQEGNPITPGSTTVEITLHPEGTKTRLRLVHRGLPDDAVEPHIQGWTHYLDRLAQRAAGGDPGPDRRPGGGE
jgi:uncharacterized protein YndB with AHSA1/START domain